MAQPEQPEMMKRLDFVMVSLDGTHPPIDMDENPQPCQGFGKLSRFCSLSAHTRSGRFGFQEKTITNGVAICCFDC